MLTLPNRLTPPRRQLKQKNCINVVMKTRVHIRRINISLLAHKTNSISYTYTQFWYMKNESRKSERACYAENFI